MPTSNPEVTNFLNDLQHPLHSEINVLRDLILGAIPGMEEAIKWNGPNYSFNGADRITMRVQPPTQKMIQVIFHRGVAKQAPLANRLIDLEMPILTWKDNDRAVMTFRGMADVEQHKEVLSTVVRKWIAATM